MKIAIWYNLPSGGGKRALHDQVSGLVERGHHIEVWCPPTANRDYMPLSDLVEERVVPLTLKERASRNPLTRVTFAHHHLVSRVTAMEKHCRRCAREIEAGGFDLLFAGSCMWFGAPMIGRFVAGPKVLYLQEPFRFLYETSDASPWPAMPASAYARWKSRSGGRQVLRDFASAQAARVQMREELQSVRSFDTVLVNSRFSRESLLRAYNLDAQVCYLGIDTSRFSPLDVPRERLVIGVGSVEFHKNVEFVIRAVAQISGDPVLLLWIGNVANEDYVNKMKALAAELKVNLRLKVNVSDTELVEWFNRAQVMVYAPRLEPFGYTPLEANACETPVVGLAQGGVRETVSPGENGVLVDDPQQMAAELQRLLDDPAQTRELGTNARQYVLNQWSQSEAIDRLESKLKSALPKSGSAVNTLQYASQSQARS